MHHIFVEELNISPMAKEVRVTRMAEEENFNHLANVLRVKKGEEILVTVIPFNFTFDYRCVVKDVSGEEILLDIIERTTANELPIRINLYQGISKADKLEYIIEKAVELGVYSIIPVDMEYCVAKIESKKEESKLQRFNKISKSAAEQSKRNIIPEVMKPLTFDEMIKNWADKKDDATNIIFYENANGLSYTKSVINECKKHIGDSKYEINILIGPEGGVSDKEIAIAKSIGAEILTLGDRILRTETASVTALSILMYELQN